MINKIRTLVTFFFQRFQKSVKSAFYNKNSSFIRNREPPERRDKTEILTRFKLMVWCIQKITV